MAVATYVSTLPEFSDKNKNKNKIFMIGSQALYDLLTQKGYHVIWFVCIGLYCFYDFFCCFVLRFFTLFDGDTICERIVFCFLFVGCLF